MDKITPKEFLYKQPAYPEAKASDMFFHKVANDILDLWIDSHYLEDIDISIKKRCSLNITSYYQDILSDSGLWRCFINANRHLYGFSIPFHEEGEEYVDYELNVEDIRFLTWYNIAMLDDSKRFIYPHDKEIIGLAQIWFEYLNNEYDDAPVPKDYNLAMGLEFTDPEDQEKIYHLGSWLFLHSYLLTPAFNFTLSEIMSSPDILQNKDLTLLQNKIEQAMTELPTGPIALFITEWLKLIIEGKLPNNSTFTTTESKHPYYSKFVEATGKTIKYFGSYHELNNFLVKDLKWKSGEEHLTVLKEAENIILMVNPNKGMLAARNVAQYIADPENPYYDKNKARKDAIKLLTERGKCPVDLLKYACTNNFLPDAVFPETEDHEIIAKNWDFIARCYLQQYYRD